MIGTLRKAPAIHALRGVSELAPRLIVPAVLLFAGFATGCRLLNGSKKEVRWAITLHLKARQGDGEQHLVTSVRDLLTDEVHLIRRFPLASSRFVMTGEVVEGRDGQPAVTFTMDPFHRLKWQQIVAEHGSREVAVCIDGYYRFMWRLPMRYDTETHQVTIEGPWEAREAELVAEWASRNFENLSKTPMAPSIRR